MQFGILFITIMLVYGLRSLLCITTKSPVSLLTNFDGNVRYERLGRHGAYKLRGRPTQAAPPQATRTPETDTAEFALFHHGFKPRGYQAPVFFRYNERFKTDIIKVKSLKCPPRNILSRQNLVLAYSRNCE